MAQAKIERLMNLIAYLSDATIPKTVREIIDTIPGYPDNFESARRSFERDKEELRSMNFEVVIQENPSGEAGYIISKESTYYDVDLSATQRNIVEYALELYAPEDALATSAITKLGGMNPENEIREVSSLPVPALIDEMYQACAQGNAVDIIFKGQLRHVLPHRIIARKGYWYLESTDLSINEKRTFRADRITEIKPGTEVVDSLAVPEESDDVSQTIVVRVHPHLQQQFCDTWQGRYDDTEDTITFTVSRDDIFVAQLFEYSGFVSVISPQELADKVNALIENATSTLEKVS